MNRRTFKFGLIQLFILVMLCGLAAPWAWGGVVASEVDAPPPQQPIGPGYIWASAPPDDCPFKPSETLKDLRFTGRHAQYTHADTWYPSWATDGNMYSPWTDGNVNGVTSTSGGRGATTGYATITGDNPLKLQVINQGVYKSDPYPYVGRYPCGTLVYNGVWYYGTYCLLPGETLHEGILYGWPIMGPFVGFRYSTDFGKTWTQTPCTPAKPLFGENSLNGGTIKIGSPHFVDFGRNLEHSPDGKAYLVAHGVDLVPDPHPRYANDSWITGDAIYLLRVTPSIQNINDASKYECFAGRDAAAQAIWTHDFGKIQPMAQWKDNMGCVTMTYDAPLKKFLMCVTDGTNTTGFFNTYILESDQITGPWKLATYMEHFGEEAYFVNIPSKFIGNDGRTFWLCYAANYAQGWLMAHFRSRPPGSRYALCLHEVNILSPNDALPPTPPHNPMDDVDNMARRATVTVSSTLRGYSPLGAVDGNVGGYPGEIDQEWASKGEKDTAMIRLNWPGKVTVDRVWLFDRPNPLDQITSALLVFSDGSTIPVGPLPKDAKKGVEVRFDPKTIKWLALMVTGVSPSTVNVGLAEIAVFRAKAPAR